MGTTRRPKLLRDFATPWGTAYAGTLLEPSGDYYGRHWRLRHTHGIPDSDIDATPSWFAWVDVCDDCGKEVCDLFDGCAKYGLLHRVGGCGAIGCCRCNGGPATCRRRGVDVCHGHAPKPPYPMGDDEYGYIVHGNGRIDPAIRQGAVAYPVWRTRAHAERFATLMKLTATDLQRGLNTEARK